MSETVATLVGRTLDAFDALTAVADAVTDEAQYVTDLGVVWRARLSAVATARGAETVTDEARDAIDAATAESATVDDPHRAIDWLSTLPQIALLTLREPA